MAGLIQVYTPNSFQTYNSMRVGIDFYDSSFTSIGNNGGYCQLNSAGMSYESEGDIIYIKGTGNAQLDGYQVVKSVLSTHITIDLAYNALYASLSGYVYDITNKLNRYAIIEVYYVTGNSATASMSLAGSLRIALTPLYDVWFDPAPLLRSTHVYIDDRDYSTSYEVEDNLSGSWKYRMREYFNGSSSWSPEPDWTAYSSIFTYIAASLKLYDSFLLNQSSSHISYVEDQNNPGKFLTLFDQPIYNKKLPFDLTVLIHNSAMFNEALFQDFKNLTGVVVQSRTEYVVIGTTSAYKYLIRKSLSRDVHGTAASVDIQIKDYSTETVFGELKTIEINQPCDIGNSIYIKWLNRLSGYDYYLFGSKSDLTIYTDNGDEYSKDCIDLFGTQTRSNITHKDSHHVYKLSARVKRNNKNGIIGLLESPFVQMLVNPQEYYDEFDSSPPSDPKWLTVKIKNGSFSIGLLDDHYYEVTLEIELPTHRSQIVC